MAEEGGQRKQKPLTFAGKFNSFGLQGVQYMIVGPFGKW